jgi:hypothetical protein
VRKAIGPLALLSLAVLLSGCPTDPTMTVSPTVTVSGTITSYTLNLAQDATISMGGGATHLDERVTVAAVDPQTGSYSFSAVAPTNWDVSVTVTSRNNWPPDGVVCMFTVEGRQLDITSSTGTNPKTFTLKGVNIAQPTTIDIQLRAGPKEPHRF